VPDGALLCCYTDGLVERRDQHIDEGFGRLTDTLGHLMKDHTEGAQTPPPVGTVPLAEEACTAIMRALVGNAVAKDDIALLTLHRSGRRD
jgi:hypothetical protein